MTVIDQAFIKAYKRQDAAPETAPFGSARSVRPAVAFPERPQQEVVDVPTDMPADASLEAATVAAAPLVQDLGTSGFVASPEAEPPKQTPVDPTMSAPNVFRPSFQVDSFAWPAGCTRLRRKAAKQLDRLADSVTFGLKRGQKAVAISGCRQGEGCTTLLLCLARRLAKRGLKVAIIDADFENPLLARRLGLLPEVGWEELLAGQLPVAEVTIESIHDRLAVLPLCGSLPGQGCPSESPSMTSLNVLREHYDLVLVDLGEFSEGASTGSGPHDVVARWIDAVVLVHNVRSTPQAELTRARTRVQAAGIAEAGIVENFVSVRRIA